MRDFAKLTALRAVCLVTAVPGAVLTVAGLMLLAVYDAAEREAQPILARRDGEDDTDTP